MIYGGVAMEQARHSSIPAVYLILLNARRETLLLRRKDTGYCDGLFSLPAGHCERGESLRNAMCREAKEELGITVYPTDLRFVHVQDRNCPDGHRLDFFFVCERWEGEVVNAEPHKCSELLWSPFARGEADIALYIRYVLTCVHFEGVFSEENW